MSHPHWCISQKCILIFTITHNMFYSHILLCDQYWSWMWAIIGPLCKNSKMYTEPVCTRRLEISLFTLKIHFKYTDNTSTLKCIDNTFIHLMYIFSVCLRKKRRSPTSRYIEILYKYSCSCIMAWWWPTFRTMTSHRVIYETCCMAVNINYVPE